MHKLTGLFSILVAMGFMGYSAMQMNKAAKAIKMCDEPGEWVGTPTTSTEQRSGPPADARISRRDPRDYEPAYKLLIRCLGDIDDLLDTVKDPAGFAMVKPMILSRVRQHVAEGKNHPDQGMTQLSKAAAKEFQEAVNRHTVSMIRANEKATGVAKFFEKEVAPLVNPK
jgi:hypothetical protein